MAKGNKKKTTNSKKSSASKKSGNKKKGGSAKGKTKNDKKISDSAAKGKKSGASKKTNDKKSQSVRKLRVEKTETKKKSGGKGSTKKSGGKKKDEVEVYMAKAVKNAPPKKKTEAKKDIKKQPPKKTKQTIAQAKELQPKATGTTDKPETKMKSEFELTSIYSIDEDEFDFSEYERTSLLGIDEETIDPRTIYEKSSTGLLKQKKEEEKPKRKARPSLQALAKKVKSLRDMVLSDEVKRHGKDDTFSRFRLLSESLVDVVWTTDLDLNFTYCSPSIKKQLGYTPVEVMKLTPEDLMTEEAIDDFGVWYVDALEAETSTDRDISRSWTLELEQVGKKGERVWMECTVSFIRGADGNPKGILGVSRNITERKVEMEALNDSLARYKTLYESSKDGIIHSAMNGTVVDANRAYLDMLGYTLEEVQGLRYTELTPAKWHDMEKEIIKTQIVKRGFSDEYEKEYIRKDGTIIPIAIRVWLIIDANGKPAGFWAMVRDITTRNEMEEQLKRSERRLKLITENTSDLITVCDLDGTIKYTSPSFTKLYYSENDLLDQTYFELLKPDDQEEIMNFVEGALLDEQDKIGAYFENYIKDKVGKWHLLESTMNVTKTQGGMRGTMVIISRMSTKKRRSTKRGGGRKKSGKKK